MNEEARSKFIHLKSLLKDAESAVLAFSGGVDSSFLLASIKLSGLKAVAVTAKSETTPEQDAAFATSLAKDLKIDHRIIRTEELSKEAFSSNPPDRCFFCKDELFRRSFCGKTYR